MTIIRENKEKMLSFGIADNGLLTIGDCGGCYFLPDTPENREKMLAEFEHFNKEA